MSRKLSPVITGTLYLSAAGILTRLLGFFYRIWLGNLIGPEELGLYQLVFPIYAICLSLCGGPFQTAISKYTAESLDFSHHLANRYLKLGICCSLLTALCCSVILFCLRRPVSLYFLLNERCQILLPYIALSIPLSALHSCITGWYYGQKKTAVPAISNLAEQTGRMLFVWLLIRQNHNFTVIQVGWALAVGELAAAFLTGAACLLHTSRYFITQPVSDASDMRSDQHHDPKTTALPGKRECLRNLFSEICPLTANRLTMSFLQSVESVMIPSRLMLFGLPEAAALSMYGTLTGMAFSFIMFPTALTGSFALMLMPDIAQAHAENRTAHIRKASRLSLSSCFFMGCGFTLFFFLFGEWLGNLCFPGTLAGTYIRALSWLCPFIYLNSILTSILCGISKTSLTFVSQLAGLLFRLSATIFLVPLYGMECYFLALLGSQLLMCGLNLWFFCQARPYRYTSDQSVL